VSRDGRSRRRPRPPGLGVRTVSKWLRPSCEEGEQGLLDRSSTPASLPHRTPEERVETTACLRRLGMSAAEIARVVSMPLSTVSAVSTRIGWGSCPGSSRRSAPRCRRGRSPTGPPAVTPSPAQLARPPQPPPSARQAQPRNAAPAAGSPHQEQPGRRVHLPTVNADRAGRAGPCVSRKGELESARACGGRRRRAARQSVDPPSRPPCLPDSAR
jgi:hypothetical protein